MRKDYMFVSDTDVDETATVTGCRIVRLSAALTPHVPGASIAQLALAVASKPQ